MTDSNPHALTGAYALDALDGEELVRFRAHLDECDSCPTEAAELRNTAIRMFSLVELTPPAELRDRVLHAVNRTPQLAPLPVSLADRRERGRKRIIAAAGGLLAAAAVAAGALVFVNADETPTVGTDTLSAQIQTAADAVQFEPNTATGAVDATIILSPSLDAAVIDVTNLPAPEAGKTYQAWVFAGDEVIPSDTFEPSAEGVVTTVIEDASAATGFGVTIEPDGGSPTGKPTTVPLLVFELAVA